LKSGYWQAVLHLDGKEKTVFSTVMLWELMDMSSGLCNAPATFELLMETILRGSHESCLVYLNVMIGCTFQEHLHNIWKVFQRLCVARPKLIPEKCHLFQMEIRCIEYTVSPEGITTETVKLRAVQGLPTLKNKHEIRS
jgi:hypothetical protein